MPFHSIRKKEIFWHEATVAELDAKGREGRQDRHSSRTWCQRPIWAQTKQNKTNLNYSKGAPHGKQAQRVVQLRAPAAPNK